MDELSNKLVSAVIVTFGIKDYLGRCIDSLKAQSHREIEVVVIDNSQGQNLFYCAGLNKGIRLSRGDFVLCLNDDVTLDSEFVREALRGFEVSHKIGMVSGKILRFDAKFIDSAGLFLTPWRAPRERGYGKKDKGQFDRAGYIFGVNGAAAFYRRKMLEEIRRGEDYFDSDYRFFYEDLDIAWRAQNAGWRAYYTPLAVAYHLRGGSLRPQGAGGRPCGRRYLSDDFHIDLIKNRYLTIIKNESRGNLLLCLPFIALYDFIIWSYIALFRLRLIKLFLKRIPFIFPCKKHNLR